MTETQERTELDSSGIQAKAIEELERTYEGEAARLIEACTLKVVDLQIQPPRSREGLHTIGVTIVAPEFLGRYLLDTPEIQGRVRMALDRSLGMHAYVARFSVELDSATTYAA